jgi:hypothetical protein
LKIVPFFFSAALAVILLTECSSMESQQTKPTQAHGTQKAVDAAGSGGHVWHMKKAEAKTTVGWDAIPQWNIPAEPQKQVVAMSMLVPSDWTFAGGPKMVSPNDCVFTSARLGFVAMSPDKKSGLISTPAQVSMWSSDPQIVRSVRQDNQQYSHMQVCKLEQPQPLAQRISSLVGNFGKGATAVGQMEPVPGASDKLNASLRQANQALAAQGSHVEAELGRIRLKSNEGDPSEGYLTAMQVVRTDRLPNGASIITIDVPMEVVSFAPQGKYAQMDAMFRAMLDSIQVGPEFERTSMQASANMQHIKQQMKARINQIAANMAADNLNAARQQQAIRQGVQDYSNKVHANVAANRSAALEHSSQQFSMYMGDQALYHDPSTGQNVQMSSGYGHAWASSTGNSNEYILSDSPSFNPNGQVGSGSWTQMQEVR